MDDSAVFAVRAKYADELEELVQCPVCFERPKGQVAMCVQGHHVCQICKDLMFECPVCKGPFSMITRNFAVEELCSKLNEIILSLLEPQSNNSTATPLPTIIKKSTSTQTDSDTLLADDSVVIIDDNTMSCCRIGFCQSQFPADCMVHHVSDYHSANLVQASDLDKSFAEEIHKNFKLNYDFEKLFDFAVNSKDFGMFFFNLHIDKEGDLYFTLQTTNPSQDNKFSYALCISINRVGCMIDYDGLIPTNLTDKKYLLVRKCKKEFFKSFFKNDKLTESDKRSFQISLSIIRI